MRSVWFLILFGSLITYHCFTTVSGEEAPGQAAEAKPSFDQCKPYVDAALKGGEAPDEAAGDATGAAAAPPEGGGGSDDDSAEDGNDTKEDADATPGDSPNDDTNEDDDNDSQSEQQEEADAASPAAAAADDNDEDDDSKEAGEAGVEQDDDSKEDDTKGIDGDSAEDNDDSKEGTDTAQHTAEDDDDSKEADEVKPGDDSGEDSKEEAGASADDDNDSKEDAGGDDDSKEDAAADTKEEDDSTEEAQPEASPADGGSDGDSGEDSKEEDQRDAQSAGDNVADQADQPDSDESQEKEAQEAEATAKDSKASVGSEAPAAGDDDSKEDESSEANPDDDNNDDSNEDGNDDDVDIGYTPRSREHVERILALEESEASKSLSGLVDKATQATLKELKSIYEQAIKPLETTYKYRDLSNRHFGDPEIFSKPLVLFMGPWSGGKSTIINWLLGVEEADVGLRTGADPSPAQFNIMTHGEEDEILDGTQLAADWTFSGLQKFGQAFLDRLRGRRLPNRLLEKVNLVEIPGILEVRKQVERSFPFNDACQWFIDRADILFLVYDPAKLDIGPETEAILDQLKGRENQVRIVLNKADTVKPDELLRLQATLIWNISPLMASAEPPTLYVASLWGRPLNPDSPTSLLLAHENNFLKDIRDATEKRVETRIAAARRFAVRVRNHAKMCDCYLNTYNNHRSFFSNKKKISDDIIENPQNYHIYEGLATLRNISRYDLPDPDTYRDFFRLNPLWEFPTLASTCTYFRGCPINKLDIAIAYDLPELLGRYRRQRESIVSAQAQGPQAKTK